MSDLVNIVNLVDNYTVTDLSSLLSICFNRTVKVLVTNFTYNSIKLLITITGFVATLVLNVSSNEQNLKFVYNPVLTTQMSRSLISICLLL